MSRRQVAQLADTLAQQRDPAAAEKRHRRQVRDRRLEIVPGLECTASLRLIGAAADQALAAYNQVDARARRVKATGDQRSLDQIRCDLSLALLNGTARFQLAEPAKPKVLPRRRAEARRRTRVEQPDPAEFGPVDPADKALFAPATRRRRSPAPSSAPSPTPSPVLSPVGTETTSPVAPEDQSSPLSPVPPKAQPSTTSPVPSPVPPEPQSPATSPVPSPAQPETLPSATSPGLLAVPLEQAPQYRPAAQHQPTARHRPADQDRPASVGCDCEPGGFCGCGCGTAYADPDELAALQRFYDDDPPTDTGLPTDTGTPANAAPTNAGTPESPTDAPLSESAAQTGTGAPEAAPPDAGTSERAVPIGAGTPTRDAALTTPPTPSGPMDEVFPVVPVVPGEIPGRATGLPETVLTVPLETVLGWIADNALRPGTEPATTPTRATAPSSRRGSETEPGSSSDPGSSAGPTSLASPTGPDDQAGNGMPSTALAQPSALPQSWLEKIGPLVESIAQRVLAARLTRAENEHTGEFRIAITNKQGRVVQYHALHARTLRGLLREAVAADYGTCLFPTCATQAIRCQADHAREYALIRSTHIGNIEPLCGPDHTVKTKRGYRVQRTNPEQAGDPATWQLLMRSGHRYPLTINGTQLPTGTTATRPSAASTSVAPDAHDPPPF